MFSGWRSVLGDFSFFDISKPDTKNATTITIAAIDTPKPIDKERAIIGISKFSQIFSCSYEYLNKEAELSKKS